MSQTKNKVEPHPKDIGRKPSKIFFKDGTQALFVDHALVKPGWVYYVKDGSRSYINRDVVEEVTRVDV